MRIVSLGMMLVAAATTATVAGAQVTSNVAGPPDAAPAAPPAATPTATMPMIRVVPATAPPPGVQPVSDKYKTELVCKTSVVTGSLIMKRKTCLTRKQWAYVNDAHEDEARKLMMDNMGKPSGN